MSRSGSAGYQESVITSKETWLYANVIKGETNMDKNVYAAIAMALYEYSGNNVHDKEPGIITIKPRHTLWNAKFLGVTPKP